MLYNEIEGSGLMAQVNIRIDDTLKEQGEKLFASLGMSLSAAISVFISQSVREGGLPFAVTTRTDPFMANAEQVNNER